MTAGTVTYAGLAISKGAKVTLTRGFTPDKISVRMIPQSTLIASRASLTISYGDDDFVLPNCLADKSNVWLSGNGFTGTITFQDRRWVWSRYPAVTYHWNVRDYDGEIIADTQVSLRDIVDELLGQIGESGYDLSVVSNSYYPEIDVENEPPVDALQKIFFEHGFTIALNSGSDPVTVFGLGVAGQSLPAANQMSYSVAVDPPTIPQACRVNFGPSVVQARFELVPVGYDTDGTIKEIDNLSFAPAGGWESTSFNLQEIADDYGVDEFELAEKYVWKLYRIKKFTGDTLIVPDGSGTLNSINQVLPLKTELLKTITVDGGKTRNQPTVIGSHFRVRPSTVGETAQGSLVEIPYTVNAHAGMVLFKDVVFKRSATSGEIDRPDLFLEAAFSVKDDIHFGVQSYHKDVSISVSGVGYHNAYLDSHFRQAVVNYDRDNAIQSVDDNETDLDQLAATHSAVIASSYTYQAAEMAWYNRPKFDIKLDGQISQVMHVVSDGDDGEPGHYSAVGRNLEFDRFIMSEAERRDLMLAATEERRVLSRQVRQRRRVKGNG